MASRRSSIGAQLHLDKRGFKAALDSAKGDAQSWKTGVEAMKLKGGALTGQGIGIAKWTELNSKIQVIGGGIKMLGSSAVSMGKSLFDAEASFESLIRGLSATGDGSETLRAELAALQEVAKMPGLGFREAIQGATALKAVKLTAGEAREALQAFGNALANVGNGKAELDAVLVSIQSMISARQVDMDNLKEIATRVPGFLELAARVPKDDPVAWVRGVITELKKLPQAAESARDKVDNLKDAMDQKRLGLTGGKAAGIGGALATEAMRMLQGGNVSLAGLTEAVSGEDLISKYQPTEAELARRKKVREELAAAEQEQARLAKQKVKDEEAAEKLKKGTPVREAAQQNLDVLRLRAAGRNKQADKLEQQQETARRAKELEDAGMDPAQAASMAGEESKLKKAMASGRRTTYRGESSTGFRGLAANRELKERYDLNTLNEEWQFPGLDGYKAMQSKNTLKPQAEAKAAGAANAAAGDPVSKAITYFGEEMLKYQKMTADLLKALAPLPATKLP